MGYPGHRPIAHANYVFSLIGRKTGAFQAVVSRDPQVYRPECPSQFHAVFLNNTVGNLFRHRELRASFIDLVRGGGGLLGIHGATEALSCWPGAREDWPKFSCMLGARGASHRDSNELVFIKLDDRTHPLNACFPKAGLEYRDELSCVHEQYSREPLRVLSTIGSEKTDTNQGRPGSNCHRPDNGYALAWVRQYGQGRVFYCTIGHKPYVFLSCDPMMLKFYLGAIQFACGVQAVCPGWQTVLDIGGQDTKVIQQDEAGRVKRFEMNDRSAAGVGRFLELMVTALGYELSRFAQAALAVDQSLQLSSMCAVFADFG